jgi:hypothetical protein
MCTKSRVGGRNCPLAKCQSQKRLELQLKLSRTLSPTPSLISSDFLGWGVGEAPSCMLTHGVPQQVPDEGFSDLCGIMRADPPAIALR